MLTSPTSDFVGFGKHFEGQPVAVVIDQKFPVTPWDAFGVPLSRRVSPNPEKVTDLRAPDPRNNLLCCPNVLHVGEDWEIKSHCQPYNSHHQHAQLCKYTAVSVNTVSP